MDKQLINNKDADGQAKPWSDAELRRATRVFELLIRIDKRQKGRSNDGQRSTDNTR